MSLRLISLNIFYFISFLSYFFNIKCNIIESLTIYNLRLLCFLTLKIKN